MTLTVNRDPVADIVPHVDWSALDEPDPWVPSHVLREIVRDSPTDPGLLTDLAAVRGSLVEEP
jgi:hypothetical protein